MKASLTKLAIRFILVVMVINRSIFDRLSTLLAEPEVLILVGPRQVGKSTLLRKLEKYAQGTGLRTKFFDLEQPAQLNALAGSSAHIQHSLTADVDIVFIDEFYYLEDAGKIFKAIFDHAKNSSTRCKVVASGSSSLEIHGHLRESLAGRCDIIRISPLSFEELADSSYGNFDQFLKFGGLPGIVTEIDEARKQERLQQYLQSYLLKDIRALVKEENVRAMNSLLYLLAQRQGQLIDSSSISRDVGLSVPTVNRYFDILEQTYVNFLLPSYSRNISNELRKSRKTYLYDLGIRNSLLKDFRLPTIRPDQGQIFESFVFLTLKTKLKPNMELYFWRTKAKEEIDFVLVQDRVPLPIEVKSRISVPEIPSAIRRFSAAYPESKISCTVSDKTFEPIKYNGCVHYFFSFEDCHRLCESFAG
jgi:uncharacterized protein